MSSGCVAELRDQPVGHALDREVVVLLVAAVLAQLGRHVGELVVLGVERVDALERERAARRGASCIDSSIFPRSSILVKIPYAGGQVPTHTLAPASASFFAIANPKPQSSATPATNARLPVRSIESIAGG